MAKSNDNSKQRVALPGFEVEISDPDLNNLMEKINNITKQNAELSSGIAELEKQNAELVNKLKANPLCTICCENEV